MPNEPSQSDQSMTSLPFIAAAPLAFWQPSALGAIQAHARANVVAWTGQSTAVRTLLDSDMLDACILAASNEDGVQDCMRMWDDDGFDGKDEELTKVEECILTAASEDDVQACMQQMDMDEVEGEVTMARTALSTCLGYASNEDDVEECIADSDDSDQHACPRKTASITLSSFDLRSRDTLTGARCVCACLLQMAEVERRELRDVAGACLSMARVKSSEQCNIDDDECYVNVMIQGDLV